MFDKNKITAIRMERQHLTRKANETEYIHLYRDLQPGQNVYWNGFCDPPSLTLPRRILTIGMMKHAKK